MTEGERRFFRELNKKLGRLTYKQEIIAEYETHVFELLEEESVPDDEVYTILVERLGSPSEIAKIWKSETKITPKKTQWLFAILNTLLFAGGALLTYLYNVFGWDWIESVWGNLTSVPFIIIIVYMLFWVLLGYEIGKEFGDRGLKLLRKTFGFSIIPNLVLMYLVVFHLIPHDWFQPLLNAPFIVTCIVLTVFLYPISWMGYRFGRRASV